MKSPRTLAFAVLLAGLIAAVVALGVLRGRNDDDGVIRVSGNVEVVAVDVSFKIPGRVVERPVDEGQEVAKGALIARLDTADLDARVAAAAADLGAAEAALAELVAGSREEEKAAALAARDQAKAAIARCRADEGRLRDDLGRAEQLFKNHSIAQEAYDHARAAFEMAVARRSEAEANHAQADAQCRLVMAGARKEQKDQAAQRVAQARAALELAKVTRAYAELTSPLAGVVLSKNVEAGQYVSPGTPVVTIGDVAHPWVRAYVDEIQKGRIHPGQEATVTTDSHPGKTYRGRVSFIAEDAEFTPKNVQTPHERVKLVYRIKVEVSGDGVEKEIHRGMPADVEIGE